MSHPPFFKRNSVTDFKKFSGHLELTKKCFIMWSTLSRSDPRHQFVSRLVAVGRYPFHIEINSNPFEGVPGWGNEFRPASMRMFGIRLVCDHSFPDPTLRLSVKYTVILKIQDYRCDFHKIQRSAEFSPKCKSDGILVGSEVSHL